MRRIIFTNGNLHESVTMGDVTRTMAIVEGINEIAPDSELYFRMGPLESNILKDYGTLVPGYQAQYMGLPAHLAAIKEKEMGRKIPDIRCIEDVMMTKGLFSEEYITSTLKEELELVERVQPDVIFDNFFDLIMPIVAKKNNIKFVSQIQTPWAPGFRSALFPTFTPKSYIEPYNRILKYLGLPLISDVRELFAEYYSSVSIVPSIPELEDMETRESYEYVGSLLPDNMFSVEISWKKTKPTIFVYFSSGQLTPDIYIGVLLDTFLATDYEIIVALGDHEFLQSQEERTIHNLHFYRHVPASKVVPMCDLVIHHGGHNSTVLAIRSQVPALIFPGLQYERYYNASKAQEIGCAKQMLNADFNKDTLLNSIEETINNSEIKENLEIYSNKIKSAGGKKRAAELILNI